MEHWSISGLTFFHVEKCPLRTASHAKICKFSEMLFWVSLKMIPLYHISSNAFDISRKTLLTSSPSSKDFYISCVIDISWMMQESTEENQTDLKWVYSQWKIGIFC